MRVVWSRPVAAATVTGTAEKPVAMAGVDAAVAAVGQRQFVNGDAAGPQPVAQPGGDLGRGEAALELVRCQEDLHDLFRFHRR